MNYKRIFKLKKELKKINEELKALSQLPEKELNWSESKKYLKKELKEEFPSIRFYFRKDRNTLFLSYIDGNIPEAEVIRFVKIFEGKAFDGMNDSTTYFNTKLAFGYIIVSREVTDKKLEQIFNDYVYLRTLNNVNFDLTFEEFMSLKTRPSQEFIEFYDIINKRGNGPYDFLTKVEEKKIVLY